MTSERGPFHLIGIGGVGMSAIARILHQKGYGVTGSDIQTSDIIERLKRLGIRVELTHSEKHVGDARSVIYSSSIKEDNPELLEAHRRKISILHRSEILARISQDQFVIAVCGTHGKSTTTALLGRIFEKAGLRPTVLVGAKIPEWNGNLLKGFGEIMILEADESDASFLRYSPDVILMTNIDSDHLDYFQSEDNIRRNFEKFTLKLKPGGFWAGCAESKGVRDILKTSSIKRVSYGLTPKENYWAEDITLKPGSGSAFCLKSSKGFSEKLNLKLVGKHNVLNALGASTIALEWGVSLSEIREALRDFGGAARRFEILKNTDKLTLIDDYAHHPTEIRVTLEAVRSYSSKPIKAYFQPHRYSRTRILGNEFINAFDIADELYITDIYAAGEKPLEGVSGRLLADQIRDKTMKLVTYVSEADLKRHMLENANQGGLILTMGAGSIGAYLRQMTRELT